MPALALNVIPPFPCSSLPCLFLQFLIQCGYWDSVVNHFFFVHFQTSVDITGSVTTDHVCMTFAMSSLQNLQLCVAVIYLFR
jgi:hypothetical protein